MDEKALKEMYQAFSEVEKKYVDNELASIKLTPREKGILYGDENIIPIHDNENIEKYVLHKRLSRKQRKNLPDKLELEKLIELVPIARNIYKSALNGEDTFTDKQVKYSEFILSHALPYVKKRAEILAQIDSDMDAVDEKETPVLNINLTKPAS
jgi:hypothetical protein